MAAEKILTELNEPMSSTNGLTVHCMSLHDNGRKLAPKQCVSAWLSDSVGVQLKFREDSLTLRPIVDADMSLFLDPVRTTEILTEDPVFHLLIMLPL